MCVLQICRRRWQVWIAVKQWYRSTSAITNARWEQRPRCPSPGLGLHLAFMSVTATVVASGVDLQKVFVGASRANQHIYLMTRAELLVRLSYLHFGHD